ncbi:hypothetical protein [Catellatospora tritici]|uniref:hypothetical protein n=1 Tax=Catellatospora tritici TaxID=2851566 RepID=UPI001C2CE680|nr:hypothetical protein [Catellatospora tritici]MBV1850043.1 hypothetical protein [Catellatospora tritici]
MTTVPLILKQEPAERFSRAQRIRTPDVAVVYATADGGVEVIDEGRPTTLLDQLSKRFQHRYEVDISDHQRWIELHSMPPAAKGGVYRFQARVNIGFRVCSPAEVVRRNFRDGLPLVSNHLMRVINQITSDFPIEEAQRAEQTVNQRLQGRQIIEGCIELYLCHVDLRPDAEARSHLARLESAHRAQELGVLQHGLNVQAAQGKAEVDAIGQQADLEARERERLALAGRPMSAQDMIALHLERNPHDTAGAMEMIARFRATEVAQAEAAAVRNHEMIRALAESRFLLPGDPAVGHLVNNALGLGPAQALPKAASSPDDWNAPLPNGGRADGPREQAQLPGIIPIYVAVDAAAAVGPVGHRLNDGLRSLVEDIASAGELARVIRLGITTFAEGAMLQRSAQDALASSLPMVSGGGRARLLPALDLLADRIPRDAEAFKQLTPALRRPQLMIFCAGEPADARQWQSAYDALSDRQRNRYAPDIVACGSADTPPELLLELASRPELAFSAYDGDLSVAVDNFLYFVQRRTRDLAQGVLDGDQIAFLAGPPGYRPAADLTDRRY